MIVACNAIYLRWMAKLLCNWYQLSIFCISFVLLLHFFLFLMPFRGASYVQEQQKLISICMKNGKIRCAHSSCLVSYSIACCWPPNVTVVVHLHLIIIYVNMLSAVHNIYIHNDDFFWTFHKYFFHYFTFFAAQSLTFYLEMNFYYLWHICWAYKQTEI